MTQEIQDDHYWGIVPIFKKRFLVFIDTGYLEDPSIDDVAMICLDRETAIKYMTLLNNRNYGLIDAPYGIPNRRLVDHWVVMKMSKYLNPPENIWYCVERKITGKPCSYSCRKIVLNRLYGEGCVNG